MNLEVGHWYWFRSKYEKIWRVCYVGQDCDEELHIHFPNTTLKLSRMILGDFDFVKLKEPECTNSQ